MYRDGREKTCFLPFFMCFKFMCQNEAPLRQMRTLWKILKRKTPNQSLYRKVTVLSVHNAQVPITSGMSQVVNKHQRRQNALHESLRCRCGSCVFSLKNCYVRLNVCEFSICPPLWAVTCTGSKPEFCPTATFPEIFLEQRFSNWQSSEW
jgi:hypothetical protein